MSDQQILWTCLPNGTSGAGAARVLNLSVLISPRLSGGPTSTLADYGQWVNWPSLSGLKGFPALSALIGSLSPTGPVATAQAAPAPTDLDVDLPLWQALFPPDTFVRSYDAPDDYSKHFIFSYSARNVYNNVQQLYQKVAAGSPLDFPPATDLGRKYGLTSLIPTSSLGRDELYRGPAVLPGGADFEQNLGYVIEYLAADNGRGRTFSPILSSNGFFSGPESIAANVVGQQQYDTFLFQLFHHPRTTQVADPNFPTPPTDPSTGKPYLTPQVTALKTLPTRPDFTGTGSAAIDFHQRVAALAKYPALMRRLGLILDLTVPFPDALGTFQIRTVALSFPSAPANITPQTVLADGESFRPRPRDTSLKGGQLDLTANGPYSLIELETEGATFKLLSLAASLAQSGRFRTPTTPATTALAALRSAGLSLIRDGRAQTLVDSTQNAMNFNAFGSGAQLYADDLLRGYRVDVSDNLDATWRSLMQRVGTYTVAGQPITNYDPNFNPLDEGLVQLAATKPSNPPPVSFSPPPTLYLHESLLRWDGWSLAAPRPFLAIGETQIEDTGSVPGLNLKATFAAQPGTLPRLRFGRQYQMQARAVDLAGNGLTTGQADPSLATDPKPYVRYEPVAAPQVVLRTAPILGESLERIVIRTAATDPPPADATLNVTSSDRHFAPPKTGEDIAEAHGMLDGPGGLQAGSYATIVAGDKSFGSLAIQDDGTVLPPGTPVPAGSATPHFYPYDPDAQAVLPYLPDPLCAGVALRYLPGLPASSVTPIAFPGDWPHAQPFRLSLQAGPFRSTFDPTQRLLTVTMPEGESATVRMSSYLPQTAPGNALGNTPPPALDLMGIWNWVEAANPPGLPRLKALALQGRHWMLTPYRDLHLVHAVQKPLITPTLSAFVPQKVKGDTFATFAGLLACDGKSTSQLDFQALWTEPMDDGTNLNPDTARINGHAHAFQIPLRFHLDAFGRFPIGNPIPILDLDPTSGPPPVEADLAAYNTVTQQLGFSGFGGGFPGQRLRHEFRDTKYRRVAYTPIATTAFREFFPADAPGVLPNVAPNLDFTRQAPSVTVDILNSARPAAPKVLYVVPTFRFDRSTDGSQSTRRGGLRVYMDRPWYSSGDGELLGAVLWNGTYPNFFPLSKKKVKLSGASVMKHGVSARPRSLIGPIIPPIFFPEDSLPDKFRPFVTQWGADPIWASDAPTALPDGGVFLNAADLTGFNSTMLTLDELPGELVSVAAFPVAFDSTRNLWYCDIDIDPATYYFPFIRLALARYQPHSVLNAELSRVVLAEYAQLTPDRSASLVNNDGALTVTVSGVAHGRTGPGVFNFVTVGIESQPQADTPQELGWTPTTPNPTQFPTTSPDGIHFTSSGTLFLPSADAASRFRLVFREYETLNNAGSAISVPFDTTYRLVYAETLDITRYVNV